jgi:Ras GTPase-activating-like protein IQGAP2/3
LPEPKVFVEGYTNRETKLIEYYSASALSTSRQNIYFNITSPVPGTFIIALHYKGKYGLVSVQYFSWTPFPNRDVFDGQPGREKAILEMDLKLDDLLEKQQDNIQLLDLEYVQLNVNKMLHLLNKTFLKR